MQMLVMRWYPCLLRLRGGCDEVTLNKGFYMGVQKIKEPANGGAVYGGRENFLTIFRILVVGAS